MNAVEKQVRELVKVELAAANEKFPPFHSAHEGYAVILEEVEEAEDALISLKISLGRAWMEIKANGNQMLSDVKCTKTDAISLACEAIQVAAMCQKFLDMEEKDHA